MKKEFLFDLRPDGFNLEICSLTTYSNKTFDLQFSSPGLYQQKDLVRAREILKIKGLALGDLLYADITKSIFMVKKEKNNRRWYDRFSGSAIWMLARKHVKTIHSQGKVEVISSCIDGDLHRLP